VPGHPHTLDADRQLLGGHGVVDCADQARGRLGSPGIPSRPEPGLTR
jgi:hypothetical protein